MSVSKVAALIFEGYFSPESRKHPIWDFFEQNNAWFDSREHDAARTAEFMTEDFSFRSPHADHSASGESGYGDDHAFIKKVDQFWTQPLREHKHVNQISIAIESKDGFDVYMHYAVFVNVSGSPAEVEKKVKDAQGQEWDAEMPAFYHFDVVKDGKGKHHGLRTRHISMIKDTGVINDKLDLRGLGHKRSLNYGDE